MTFGMFQSPCSRTGRPVKLANGVVLGERFKIVAAPEPIEKTIGHHAVDLHTNEKVILKLADAGPWAPGSHKPVVSEHVRRLRAASSHPCTCPIRQVDIARHEGRWIAYVAMPIVNGQSLSHWVERSRRGHGVPLSRVTQFFVDISSAAAHFQHHGLPHGDISPDNVIVTDGHAVLIDHSATDIWLNSFGTGPASQTDSDKHNPAGTTNDLQRMGTLIGILIEAATEDDDSRSTHAAQQSLLDIAQAARNDGYRDFAELHVAVRKIYEQTIAAHEQGQNAKTQLAALEGSAKHAFEQRRFTDTVRLCRQILDLSPDHTWACRTCKQLEALSDQVRQAYCDIERHHVERPLHETILRLRAAAKQYPDHPDAQLVEQLALERGRKYFDQMVRGAEMIRQKRFESAAVAFEIAMRYSGDMSPPAQCYAEAVRLTGIERRAGAQIKNALEQGNAQQAAAAANAAIRCLGGLRPNSDGETPL